MLKIDEKTLKKVLKKRFDSLVGVTCEAIENIFDQDLDDSLKQQLIKDILKKNSYKNMRRIESQIAMFNNGTKISVQFERPISE